MAGCRRPRCMAAIRSPRAWLGRMAERLSYCGEQVRRGDHDRFLTALFAPAAARESLLALYAFNLEVARVRETVSEPMLGQIRLQWWREAIDGLYAGRVREHPVVTALAAAIGPAGPAAAPALTRAHFDRLIEAREFDLESRPPATLAELEAYGEATSSTLLWLAAEALGAGGEATRAALAPLGVAWALTGLIRATPFLARARRQYIPSAIVAEAGLSPGDLFAMKPNAGVERAVARLAAAAAHRLDAAAAAAPAVAPAARPLLLFGTLARAYLRRLARHGHRVDDGRAELAPTRKLLRLWWASRVRSSS